MATIRGHHKIQTTVEMDAWHATQEDHSQLTRMFISIDVVTHVRMCHIYSDDGRGNGDLILRFEMN